MLLARIRMAGLLSLPLALAACEVGAVPDSGQCVLTAPLACSKLTPVQRNLRPHIIFDTDAQFHGDPTTARAREQGAVGDQYALIYMLLRSDALQLLGVTTANANGGAISDQVSEVQRVASLCGEAASILSPTAQIDPPCAPARIGLREAICTSSTKPSNSSSSPSGLLPTTPMRARSPM